MSWQTVLGFETHIELGTNTKMFCACPADHFGKRANTQTCPVCLGLPGALPVPNAKAIEWCIKLGLALNCEINLFSKFDRKNYFYPDLPKGYQISQYDLPFCHSGWLKLASGKTIRITRVNMEEDTGKLQHAEVGGQKVSLVDFNRSGVPLVEVVTEPDFDSSDESSEFLKEIQAIVRTLGISSADMEKGSMRLEANISVRKSDTVSLPDYKVEIKNVNSFRFIKKAIEYEVTRQITLLEAGTTPTQETRGFKENTGTTVAQRSKESAHDYRYFPEPDIPPFQFTESQIAKWRTELPELPAAARARLQALGVPPATAAIIVAAPLRLQKFTELSAAHDPVTVAKHISNLPEDQVPQALMPKASALTADDQEIRSAVQKVITDNPKAVIDIHAGKIQGKFFLIGQIKKRLGDVDISAVQKILDELI